MVQTGRNQVSPATANAPAPPRSNELQVGHHRTSDELALRSDLGKMFTSNRVAHFWFRKHKLRGSYLLWP